MSAVTSRALACKSSSRLRADDGPRTRDLRLGKPTLYQLSYVRVGPIIERATRADRAGRRSRYTQRELAGRLPREGRGPELLGRMVHAVQGRGAGAEARLRPAPAPGRGDRPRRH